MALMVTAPPSRFRPPPDPPPRKSPPLEAPSPIDPPEPPDPPDVSFLLALPRSPSSSSCPSLQALTRILDLKLPLPWMVSKISGGDVPLVSTGDSTFVYRRLLCSVCKSSSCRHMDWSSISSCSDLSFLPFKGFQVHFSSSISAFCSSVEWDIKLFVCVSLELRTIALADDVLMDLTSVGSTFVLFGGPFVASMRSLTAVCSSLPAVCSSLTAVCSSLTAVCSPLSVFILAFGALYLYFSFWWQLREKFIGKVSWMNMIMAGSDYPFVSYLEQSLFPIFLHVWSELDEQVSLVLQGSSSQRVLSSAFGAVCVVLWITLDAIFQETFETVVMRFLMVPFYDLYRHPIFYFTSSLVCLVRCSFVSSFEGA
ncbi:uncharacterized protein LOC103846162 [Brassica rapa]|uniref:uncharacterized protein LOC103846162 n=1 Tax=Brassica campestris TaxID=3711 RepID=UPI00142D714E|nr:uncharacterized protein LOC103846162 [Brassica rapa]